MHIAFILLCGEEVRLAGFGWRRSARHLWAKSAPALTCSSTIGPLSSSFDNITS
jgi:hypothetical protein